jgi:hypothetical protein
MSRSGEIDGLSDIKKQDCLLFCLWSDLIFSLNQTDLNSMDKQMKLDDDVNQAIGQYMLDFTDQVGLSIPLSNLTLFKAGQRNRKCG